MHIRTQVISFNVDIICLGFWRFYALNMRARLRVRVLVPVNAHSTSEVFPPQQLERLRKGREFVGIPSVVGERQDLLFSGFTGFSSALRFIVEKSVEQQLTHKRSQ